MQSTAIVDAYFAAVRARDIDAFMALFAQDATVITPDGRRHEGAAAIHAMESAVFAASNPPTPTPTAIVATDEAAAVEIDIRTPDGTRHRMGSFYQINQARLINRLSIYRQMC